MAQTAQHYQCAHFQPPTTIRFCPNVAAAIVIHLLASLAYFNDRPSRSRPIPALFAFFLDTLIQRIYIFNLYHLYQFLHRYTGEVGGRYTIQNQRRGAPDRPKYFDTQALGKTGAHSKSPQRLKGLANLHGGRSPGHLAACQRDKLLSKYRIEQLAR
jgi:hypothetical protein